MADPGPRGDCRDGDQLWPAFRRCLHAIQLFLCFDGVRILMEVSLPADLGSILMT